MKLSIITVVFNNCDYIENTILNVLKIKESYDGIEYIIIDGSSTDGTIDIIKKYQDKISLWISEPDKGIYDAMNKGVKLANGKWINFMNAGDEFAIDCNVILDELINKNNSNDVVYGDVFIKKDGVLSLDKSRPVGQMNYSLNFCHQSSFVRKELLLKNPFSLEYKISSDYSFFLNIFLQGGNFYYVECPVSIFEYGGVSSGISKKYLKERLSIIFASHNKVKDKLWFSYKFFKMLIPFNRNSIMLFLKK